MTTEEKQLFLRDLCSRLPYGVKFNYNGYDGCDYKMEIISPVTINISFPIENCKPYLRSMSSMTEEEKKELRAATCPEGTGYFDEKYLICPMNHFGELISYEFMADILNWLNEHHFDFRGLIEKGLVLEAPEGMYKTE